LTEGQLKDRKSRSKLKPKSGKFSPKFGNLMPSDGSLMPSPFINPFMNASIGAIIQLRMPLMPSKMSMTENVILKHANLPINLTPVMMPLPISLRILAAWKWCL